MYKIKLPVLALLGSTLLWTSCRHDTSGSEPNPCQTAKANPLTFSFLENYGTPTPDTAYTKQDITFEGPGAPYTTYEWHIANDIRIFTQQKFSLYFPETLTGNFPVRLIAHRPTNRSCFPKDDGVDTLTQVLTLVPLFNRKAPIYGKFLGSNTMPRAIHSLFACSVGQAMTTPTTPTRPPTTTCATWAGAANPRISALGLLGAASGSITEAMTLIA